ncbi:MAG: hypothetical protein QM723_26680 [Myxococcaceae bacterium]
MKREVVIAVAVTLLVVGVGLGWGLYNDAQLKPFLADEWVKKSYETAREQHPDAKAIEITAEAITPDGRVHMEQQGRLVVRFRRAPTAADAKPAPAQIPGARTPLGMLGGPIAAGGCTGGLVRTHSWSGVKGRHFEHVWQEENQKCITELDGLPKCSFEQVWQKAKAKGAPDPAFADIDLVQEVGGGGSEKRWRFEITNHPDLGPPQTVFHAEFPDDC